jgi:ATP-binding cassette subfamily B (MDR/TAP) protein 7
MRKARKSLLRLQSWKFGWDFAAVTAITMGIYTWFTVTTTAWRTRFRKEANAADNKGATVAVDSLINYEAVKVSQLIS